jgi:hypothetical protein
MYLMKMKTNKVCIIIITISVSHVQFIAFILSVSMYSTAVLAWAHHLIVVWLGSLNKWIVC